MRPDREAPMRHTSTWISIEEEMPPARVEVVVMHRSGEVRQNKYLGIGYGFMLEGLYGPVIWWMPKDELPPRALPERPVGDAGPYKEE